MENSSQVGCLFCFSALLVVPWWILHSSRLTLNIWTIPKNTPEKIKVGLSGHIDQLEEARDGESWERAEGMRVFGTRALMSGLGSILWSKGLWAMGALGWEAQIVFFLIRFHCDFAIYNLYGNSKGRCGRLICSQDSTEVNCFSSSRSSYHTEVEQSHWRTKYLSLAWTPAECKMFWMKKDSVSLNSYQATDRLAWSRLLMLLI